MVFDHDDESDERDRLVAEFHALGVSAGVLAWVGHPDTDLSVLAGPCAVPFWDQILRPYATSPSLVWREPLFSYVSQAYVSRWRAEMEQSELFEAAQILAEAARAHVLGQVHPAD